MMLPELIQESDDRRREHLLLGFGKGDLVGELGGLLALLDLLLGKDEHLRHGEEADERARRVDALGKERMAEHEALGAVDGVKADCGKEQPSAPDMRPLTMDLLETPAMIVRPKIPSQNFSADMNFSASWASSGAKKYREMQLSRPPQKELQQAVASALPA